MEPAVTVFPAKRALDGIVEEHTIVRPLSVDPTNTAEVPLTTSIEPVVVAASTRRDRVLHSDPKADGVSRPTGGIEYDLSIDAVARRLAAVAEVTGAAEVAGVVVVSGARHNRVLDLDVRSRPRLGSGRIYKIARNRAVDARAASDIDIRRKVAVQTFGNVVK